MSAWRRGIRGGFCDASGGGTVGPAGAGGAAYGFVPVAGRVRPGVQTASASGRARQLFCVRSPDRNDGQSHSDRRGRTVNSSRLTDQTSALSRTDSPSPTGAMVPTVTRARGVTSGYVASDRSAWPTTGCWSVRRSTATTYVRARGCAARRSEHLRFEPLREVGDRTSATALATATASR